MKFYVSGEPLIRLKNDITNLSSYKIIDVDWILESCGLNPDDEVHGYIITSEIKRMINEALRSKKSPGIIYINSRLDASLVYSLKMTLLEINGADIMDIDLFDDKDVPKYKELYKLFDEVVFYNKYKKIRLLECKPIFPANSKKEGGK